MKIIHIGALQILDSRGNPTLQVEVVLQDGSKGVFKVPSGASTGIHEAHELRDNNKGYYGGKGVGKALLNVEQVSKELIGKEFTQKSFDERLLELDGTANKEKLGANAILGLSIAFAKAGAQYHHVPLWNYLANIYHGIKPNTRQKAPFEEVHIFANVINGGLHAGNKLNVQEFMLVPLEGSFEHKVRMVAETYQELKTLIAKEYGKEQTAVGDEGGFAPNVAKCSEALDLLTKAVKQAGYEGKIAFALDAAASDFYDEKTKKYAVEERKKLDYKKLTEFYNTLVKKYPLISIEDPFGEDDFEAWEYWMKNRSQALVDHSLGKEKEVLCVGDDLLVTNPKRIKMAKKLASSLLLKINQIGSLTEALEAHRLAQKAKWHTIVSHRSGETCDSFIADLAVALESSIKLGAPARGERVAKYNRLLEINR